MAGDFTARMREIERRVGYNDLVGHDINRNVYAHYQHEGAWFKRPSGGGPFFYLNPLMAGAPQYCREIADVLLTEGGKGAMKNAVLAFEKNSQAATGKLTGRLANGHELSVFDNGARTYFRMPTMDPLREGQRDPLRPRRGRQRRRRSQF